jgi:hypothetical protein
MGDPATRRRYSAVYLSVVTDVHDYASVADGRRDIDHLLGVPGSTKKTRCQPYQKLQISGFKYL